MKILIITEEDVFYIFEFFKVFFRYSLQNTYSIEAVTICNAFNKPSTFALARQMYSFFGLRDFFSVGIKYVWRLAVKHSVAGLCKKYNIPQWNTSDVNAADYIQRIKKTGIDCIVSIAAPQIFRSELLQSVPLGCINSHSSLLPENRGMMPVFWALYKCLPQTGVTIHYMNSKLDNGSIIRQQVIPITTTCLHELILLTKRVSAQLVHEVLTDMARGVFTSSPMPIGGSMQGFPRSHDVVEFKKRGKRIL